MPGQVSTTCPFGRNVEEAGHPIRIAELLSTLYTPSYIARVSTHNPKEIIVAKRAVRKAFSYQVEHRCFTLVEFLSTCPTNWGKTPADSLKWVEENMLPYYPIGEFKTPEEG